MYLFDLSNGTPCTLQLHDDSSRNTFDVIIWRKGDQIGFNLDKRYEATVVMLLTLEYKCDLIFPSDKAPILFSNIGIIRSDQLWLLTVNVSGKLCDRRLWPRYTYSRPGVVEQAKSNIPAVMATYDVSKYGIGILTKERLPINVQLLITFKSPELDKIMKINATAVHADLINGMYHYGCVVSTDAMFDLVNKLQSENIRKLNNDEK